MSDLHSHLSSVSLTDRCIGEAGHTHYTIYTGGKHDSGVNSLAGSTSKRMADQDQIMLSYYAAVEKIGAQVILAGLRMGSTGSEHNPH
jgi:hypothetical protein